MFHLLFTYKEQGYIKTARKFGAFFVMVVR